MLKSYPPIVVSGARYRLPCWEWRACNLSSLGFIFFFVCIKCAGHILHFCCITLCIICLSHIKILPTHCCSLGARHRLPCWEWRAGNLSSPGATSFYLRVPVTSNLRIVVYIHYGFPCCHYAFHENGYENEIVFENEIVCLLCKRFDNVFKIGFMRNLCISYMLYILECC